MTNAILAVIYGCVALVLAVAFWWFLVRVASHAWHAGMPATRPTTREIMHTARNRSTWDQSGVPPFRPVDQTLMQPAVHLGPSPAPSTGGLCVVGHYIEPRYIACWAGHRFNPDRTSAATPHEIDAAIKDSKRRLADADRAAGAPW